MQQPLDAFGAGRAISLKETADAIDTTYFPSLP